MYIRVATSNVPKDIDKYKASNTLIAHHLLSDGLEGVNPPRGGLTATFYGSTIFISS